MDGKLQLTWQPDASLWDGFLRLYEISKSAKGTVNIECTDPEWSLLLETMRKEFSGFPSYEAWLVSQICLQAPHGRFTIILNPLPSEESSSSTTPRTLSRADLMAGRLSTV